MKEKTIAICVLTILLLMFLAVGISEFLLFYSGDNKFIDTVEKSITYANSGDWNNAKNEAQKAQIIWDKGNFIVAVKYADIDFSLLNVYLTRFQNAIAQKDAKETVIEGRTSIYLFKNITSIAPSP